VKQTVSAPITTALHVVHYEPSQTADVPEQIIEEFDLGAGETRIIEGSATSAIRTSTVAFEAPDDFEEAPPAQDTPDGERDPDTEAEMAAGAEAVEANEQREEEITAYENAETNPETDPDPRHRPGSAIQDPRVPRVRHTIKEANPANRGKGVTPAERDAIDEGTTGEVGPATREDQHDHDEHKPKSKRKSKKGESEPDDED